MVESKTSLLLEDTISNIINIIYLILGHFLIVKITFRSFAIVLLCLSFIRQTDKLQKTKDE